MVCYLTRQPMVEVLHPAHSPDERDAERQPVNMSACSINRNASHMRCSRVTTDKSTVPFWCHVVAWTPGGREKKVVRAVSATAVRGHNCCQNSGSRVTNGRLGRVKPRASLSSTKVASAAYTNYITIPYLPCGGMLALTARRPLEQGLRLQGPSVARKSSEKATVTRIGVVVRTDGKRDADRGADMIRVALTSSGLAHEQSWQYGSSTSDNDAWTCHRKDLGAPAIILYPWISSGSTRNCLSSRELHSLDQTWSRASSSHPL